MRCPKCGFRDDKVIDSRQSRDAPAFAAAGFALQCAYRFTTYEQIERSDLRVIKRDRTTSVRSS
jgi:transcriptional repressor NrdR